MGQVSSRLSVHVAFHLSANGTLCQHSRERQDVDVLTVPSFCYSPAPRHSRVVLCNSDDEGVSCRLC
jgi:hypothetical protein